MGFTYVMNLNMEKLLLTAITVKPLLLNFSNYTMFSKQYNQFITDNSIFDIFWIVVWNGTLRKMSSVFIIGTYAWSFLPLYGFTFSLSGGIPHIQIRIQFLLRNRRSFYFDFDTPVPTTTNLHVPSSMSNQYHRYLMMPIQAHSYDQ